MDSYKATLQLNAPAAKVFHALTTQQGIQGWWTTFCEVGTSVGDSVVIRFGQTFKKMCIETLRQDAEIRWRVTDAQLIIPDLTRANEWIGTTITFQLKPISDAVTQLDLEHIGLTPQIECYAICSQGWNQFLESLKCYVETGKGMPYNGSAV